jgi:hypothetical protein
MCRVLRGGAPTYGLRSVLSQVCGPVTFPRPCQNASLRLLIDPNRYSVLARWQLVEAV